MCDIWKGNHNLKQLTIEDVEGLMTTLHRLGTRQVLMSGGEALLNPNFFSPLRHPQKTGYPDNSVIHRARHRQTCG